MDSPRTELEVMIEQEAKELAEVPKIPISVFMNGGRMVRCHLCGDVVPQSSLQPFDEHTVEFGGIARSACPCCHPNRGDNGA